MAPSRAALLAAAACAAASSSGAAAAPPGLYAITAAQQLVRVRANATLVPVAPAAVAGVGQSQQLAAVDAARAVFYEIGWNYSSQAPALLGWRLSDGGLHCACSLTSFGSAGLVGLGEFVAVVPATGHVVVAAQAAAGGNHSVALVTPSSCAVELVAQVAASFEDALGGAGAFDPLAGGAGAMLLQFYGTASGGGGDPALELLSVDLATGAVARALVFNYSAGRYAQSLSYAPGESAFYGMGLAPSAANASVAVRTVARLDAASLAWEVRGVVEGFTESAGTLAALDARAGVLYMVLQHDAHVGPSEPFFLVAASTADGRVLSAAQLCAGLSDCPWSLVFYQPP